MRRRQAVEGMGFDGLPMQEGRRVGVGENERTQTRAPLQQGHQARLLLPPQARSCS
jgi:hypothetical protein